VQPVMPGHLSPVTPAVVEPETVEPPVEVAPPGVGVTGAPPEVVTGTVVAGAEPPPGRVPVKVMELVEQAVTDELAQ